MAFDRLQNLGDEKWRLILNHLMRGHSAMGLARKIQQEWQDFPDIPEKTLTQQLNRLRLAAAEGMFGPKIAAQIQKIGTPEIERLNGVCPNALDRMEELATLQRQRVLSLVEKEKRMPVLVGTLLTATNAVITDYSQLLQDLQKMRFDLGMDEFRGVISTTKGVAQQVTLPNGTNIQQQVFEAVSVIDDVFRKHVKGS